MFCPKCGMELPDGSQFCPACGAQLGAQAPQQAAPQQGAKPAGIITIPKVGTLTAMFAALLCFIFGFLPLFGYSFSDYGYSYSDSYSILHSHMFDLNALFGIAKILMIIQIVVFVVYLVSQFIDINKYVNLPFKLSEKMPLIYFCTFALSLLFTLIGCIIEKGVSPAVCWYFAAVFCACGFVLVLKPDLISGLVKKPQ